MRGLGVSHAGRGGINNCVNSPCAALLPTICAVQCTSHKFPHNPEKERFACNQNNEKVERQLPNAAAHHVLINSSTCTRSKKLMCPNPTQYCASRLGDNSISWLSINLSVKICVSPSAHILGLLRYPIHTPMEPGCSHMPFASHHASSSKQLVLGIAHIAGRAKVISHECIFAARYIWVACQLDRL